MGLEESTAMTYCCKWFTGLARLDTSGLARHSSNQGQALNQPSSPRSMVTGSHGCTGDGELWAISHTPHNRILLSIIWSQSSW